MFRRRRPLLRAAVVGGGAYMAGKKVAQNSADRSAQEAGQDDRISNLEQQQGDAQQASASAAAPAGGQPDTPISEQLKQLTALHEDGSLTDDEFAAAKRKLLGI
ncbi:MAG TPA: SHOCT domain-containing protein [Streptosporangiaceae bacterium]